MRALEQHPIEQTANNRLAVSGFPSELQSIWGPSQKNAVENMQQFVSGATQGLGQATHEGVQAGINAISHPTDTAQHVVKSTVEAVQTVATVASMAGNYVTEKVSHGDANGMASDFSHVASEVTRSVQEGLTHYSQLSAHEQGRMFGHDVAPIVLSTVVAPELVPDCAGALMATKMASTVGTLAKEEGALAKLATTFENAKDQMQDISEKLGALNKRMEELARGDKASARDGQAEYKLFAGAGGEWTKLNKRFSADVVKQCHPNACVSACGEMLTNGEIKQETLVKELAEYIHPEMRKTFPTADIKDLAQELGSDWKHKGYDPENPLEFEKAFQNTAPWATEFRGGGKVGHAVVVDGMNESGEIMIRDPQDAMRYEMTRGEFVLFWSGRSVVRK